MHFKNCHYLTKPIVRQRNCFLLIKTFSLKFSKFEIIVQTNQLIHNNCTKSNHISNEKPGVSIINNQNLILSFKIFIRRTKPNLSIIYTCLFYHIVSKKYIFIISHNFCYINHCCYVNHKIRN